MRVLLELNRDEGVAIIGRSSIKKEEEKIGETRTLGLWNEELNPRRARDRLQEMNEEING